MDEVVTRIHMRIDGLLVDDVARSADRTRNAEQRGGAFQHIALT